MIYDVADPASFFTKPPPPVCSVCTSVCFVLPQTCMFATMINHNNPTKDLCVLLRTIKSKTLPHKERKKNPTQKFCSLLFALLNELLFLIYCLHLRSPGTCALLVLHPGCCVFSCLLELIYWCFSLLFPACLSTTSWNGSDLT